PGGRFARSLDGQWGFAHFGRPEDVPTSALMRTAAAEGDDGVEVAAPIEVPGAWTLQGWDAPIYTNVQMPFPGEAPVVPVDNPTGVYQRTIEVPADWAGRDVVLSLGGAESLAVVYVDGAFVGLATDSRLGSEFDLTSFVEAGGSHRLAIVVIRWSAATWIEDQDQWWHGGIQGSVVLWSRPAVHLADVGLVPGLNPDGTTGTLDLDIAVGGDLTGGRLKAATGTIADGAHSGGVVQHHAGPGDPQATVYEPAPRWWVGVSVEDLDGATLLDNDPVEVTAFDDANALARLLASDTWPGQVVRTRLEVPGIEGWSDELPSRYRVLVRLWRTAPDAGPPRGERHGADSELVEVAAVLTGFRSVEIGGRELRINGAVPLIRGVNRHEHSPTRGRYVDPETTWFELCLAKRLNVNAVRTAHAPAAPWFYDMCDELGLYVVDETNVESHGRQVSLTTGPLFTGAIIQRGLRMAQRDRNHPSVIVWSLGNEAGEGPAHHGLAGALRFLDPSRPLSYEGPIMFDLDAENSVSDLVAPMYRSVEEITAWAKSRKEQ
ncbi:MAG: glycoside hydrolase family 2 TIM barrel-domain containing protein, partial [Candidatus Microthrix subdominans]